MDAPLAGGGGCGGSPPQGDAPRMERGTFLSVPCMCGAALPRGGASWPAPPSLPPLAERRRALRAAPRDPTRSHDRAVTRRASMPGLDFVKMLPMGLRWSGQSI